MYNYNPPNFWSFDSHEVGANPSYTLDPYLVRGFVTQDSHRDGHFRSDPSRQQPPLEGGPERSPERPPYAVHVDWHALYPNEIILEGPTNKREVALTFDDGPDDLWTPRIQQVLDAYRIKATFMCVGQRVQSNPRILRRLVRDGHIVGNHSWSHPNFTKIPASQVPVQIEETTNLIHRVAGVRPRFFRPPYGALDNEVIREVIALKDKILFWNVDSLDWSGLTAEQVSVNVLAHTKPGSIILMHSAGGRGESLNDTVQALPHIIRTLRGGGYQFKTVPELLDTPAYY
ncbi:polysaccharide deacetylase family protein [Alicyclobacillus pomorum]|jgi:peptidoglycan-N-acetylglucosamine deacetylase|uniref:polysaccharide deacetylase family protein n=1 Tax=Alicyclobacillus pomorum TaxID=204470 RepID=UPI00041EACF0|nr:polysaccharide deacetylase family protein [Alicyclobacillus pomorum]